MLKFIIEYWLEILFGILISLFTIVCKKYKDAKKVSRAAKESLKILLRNEIIEKYCLFINKQNMSMNEKETINSLYTQYVIISDNQDLQDLLIKVNALPIEGCDDD